MKKFFAAILIAAFVFAGGAAEAKSLWVDNGFMSLVWGIKTSTENCDIQCCLLHQLT